MDSTNDTRFLDFAGTAGVNDEVRRKKEAEIREMDATIQRTNEKIQLAKQTSMELIKSEKHANNEARELLQRATDQRNSVAVDCGIARTLVDNVISSSLSGNDISEDARTKGMKGIAEATMERLLVHTKRNCDRKQRMVDLSSSGKQGKMEFHELSKALLEVKREIEQKQQPTDLEDKATALVNRTKELKALKVSLVKKVEALTTQAKLKIAERNATNKTIEMKTAELNQVKNAHATMVAEFTKEKNVCMEKKEHIRQDIAYAEDNLTKFQDTLAALKHQLTSAQSTLNERSKLEDEAKNIRTTRNDLAARKKGLEMELAEADRKLQGLSVNSKEVKSMGETLAALHLESDKLDEAHPSSRLDEVKKELEAAQLALQDLQHGPVTAEQLEADHKKECQEKRQHVKTITDAIEAERVKNLELVANQENPDPSMTKARANLEELKAQTNAKEERIAILKEKAFDNRGHQLLVRKYKVLKAARKLHDLESSHMAKIAKLSRD